MGRLVFSVLLGAGISVVSQVAAAAGGENPFLAGQYACGNQSLELEELADCGVTILSHQTWTEDVDAMRAYLERAHELGIRVLPYVSPEKAWDDFLAARLPQNSGGSIPYYLAVSPKDHREWIIVRADGLYQLRYGTYVEGASGNAVYSWPEPGPGPGSWYMCANAEGYPDAVLQGCRDLMDMGFDGLFIDNAVAGRLDNVPCFGPQLGKHEHIRPDQDNRYAYPALIGRMAEAIRSYGPDKICFPNGGLEEVFTDTRDAGMIESYICAAGQGRWHSWDQVKAWAKEYENERTAGRVVVALSYPDAKDHPLLDDTYYCYACARWSDLVWGGGGESRQLYRARLIVPAGPRVEADGIAYRAYDRGMVAINPASDAKTVSLPLGPGLADPADLYAARPLPVNGGTFQVTLPRESGRVYVNRVDAMRIYAEEARFQARRARGALGAAPAGPRWSVRDAAHAAGQGEIALDDARPHAGHLALRVTSEGEGVEVHASQMVGVPGGTSEPIEVAFWGRTDGPVAAEVPIGVQFADGTSDWWSPPSVRGADWTRQTGLYTPPKPVTAMSVFLTATYDQKGTAWFDEVSVREGDGSGGFGPNRLQDADFETQARLSEECARQEAALPSIEEAVAILQGAAPPDERIARALPLLLEAGNTSPEVGRAVQVGSGVTVELAPESDRVTIGAPMPATVTVRNGFSRRVTVRAPRIEGPSGFTVTLAEGPATQRLAPGESATFNASITQTQETSHPYAELTATVSCSFGAGRRLDLPARATVFLEPPLAVELPDPTIGVAEGAPASLTARVTNRTGTPVAGVLAIGLQEGFAPRSTEQRMEVPAQGHADATFALTLAPGLGKRRYNTTLRLYGRAAGGDSSLAYVPGAAGAPTDDRPTLAAADTYAWVVPVVRCPRTTAAPRLDGRLDDACWRSAGQMADFVSLDLVEPAAAPTVGMVACDGSSLYIAVRCGKPLMEHLAARIQPGAPDEGDVTSDDCVELYVDPGRTRERYVRLVVNPNAAHKVSGDARWEWACGKEQDAWVAEIALDLASVDANAEPGAVWGLNIGRLDHLGTAEGVTQHSSWAASYGTFHAPRTFGVLVFE